MITMNNIENTNYNTIDTNAYIHVEVDSTNTENSPSPSNQVYAALSTTGYTVNQSLDFIVQWMVQHSAFYFVQTESVEEANQLISAVIFYLQSLYVPQEQWFQTICTGEHSTKLSYSPNIPQLLSNNIINPITNEVSPSSDSTITLGIWSVIADQGYGIVDNPYTLKALIQTKGLTNILARKHFTLEQANYFVRERYTRRYNMQFPTAILTLLPKELMINEFHATKNYKNLKRYCNLLEHWSNLQKRDMFM